MASFLYVQRGQSRIVSQIAESTFCLHKCLSHLNQEFRRDGVVPEGQPQSQHDGEDPPLLVSRDVAPVVRDLSGERHVDVDSLPVQQLVVGAQGSHLDLGGEGMPVVDDTCQDVFIQIALQLLQHALDGSPQHHAGSGALRNGGEEKVSIRCKCVAPQPTAVERTKKTRKLYRSWLRKRFKKRRYAS
jgi:hypothetical protein